MIQNFNLIGWLVGSDQTCSTPTPNPTAADPPAAIGKELTANHEENGNDKESPHDEIGDLLER